MTPADQHQRERVLDHTHSFIVQAPAGSGKTELLTQRYLVLLAKANVPEEILAITFTRKAAAEMRIRILEALQLALTDPNFPEGSYSQRRWQLAKAVLEQDAKNHWDLLNNPSRLRIQTIDSFCASLTRQMPLLSRFGAQPELLNDSSLLYHEAAQNILAGLETDAPWANTLATLLLHCDNDQQKVEDLLCDMLARRDQWLPHIVGSFQQHNLRETLEKSLQRAIAETLIQITANIPSAWLTELCECAHFAAVQVNAIKPESFITYCLELNKWRDILTQPLQHEELEHAKNSFQGLAELLLTKDGHWRKKITKNEGFPAPSEAKSSEQKALLAEMKSRMESLLAQLAGEDELQQHLQTTRLLPPCTYSAAQWEVLTSLLELLPLCVAQLKVLFQEQEKVDYIEIAHSALLALGEPHMPTDLALRLDYRIQHILLDEFQDTSITQFRLLEQLTAGWQQGDGRTLFLVGDPMQSIYRFRKAEVGLFLQAREQGIGQVRLHPLTLSVNFRSTPTIVDWINHTFKPLMPQQVDIASGAVPFSSSMANPSALPGTITLHSLTSDNSTQEAQRVSELVQHALAENPQTKIAILVRARTHLLEILPTLQMNGIAYRAIEIETLDQLPVIQDLVALTRALLHPADRIAWLALLRAPWCGLTLAELHLLVGGNFSSTLWDCLITIDLEQFSPTTQVNLKRVTAVLSQSLEQRKRLTLSQWVYGTWLALGGPTALSQASDLDDAKIYFKLLETIQNNGDIPDITQLEQRISQLYASSQLTQDNPVEVMTIHKAKGLEFDTVILPGLERPLSPDTAQLLLCLERPTKKGQADLLLAPIKASAEEQDPIYNYLRHEEKKRAHYETIRLLYVATTRAKQHLHLIASFKTDATHYHEEIKPNKNCLLAQLWPVLGSDFVKLLNTTTASTATSATKNINHHTLKRLSHQWQLPPLPSGEHPQFVFDPQPHRNKNLNYSWNNHAMRAVGSVVHLVFQHIAQEDITLWDEKRLMHKKPTLRNLLTRRGVSPEELDSAVALTVKALQLALQDPRGRWILGQHQAAAAEYPLGFAAKGDDFKQIIMDRTFIDEQNTRWIIDYKIIEASGTDPEQFLEQEVTRYRAQLENYAKIMQTLEPQQSIRLGLYFPLQQAWREWEYS